MKIAIVIILTLVVGGIITAMILSPSTEETTTSTINFSENSQNETIFIEQTESTEKSGETADTNVEVELRRDRTGDARAAQKENKGASDLQNDLNSINP